MQNNFDKGWNRGQTKDTNFSVFKISNTMREKGIDNFKGWRDKAKMEGKIKSDYPPLKRDGDLAELLGMALGDGHVCVYPRTEELRITLNADDVDLIERCAVLIEKVFGKKAYVIPCSRGSNATKVGLYEKHISERLGMPTGARKHLTIKVPAWILKNRDFIVRYLRGLYEAEGCFCIHEPTCTFKLQFSNVNKSMLDNVFRLMKKLGFHPHRSPTQIQLSKKEEVMEAVRVLQFRRYELKGV
jgi:hypothetical protein